MLRPMSHDGVWKNRILVRGRANGMGGYPQTSKRLRRGQPSKRSGFHIGTERGHAEFSHRLALMPARQPLWPLRRWRRNSIGPYYGDGRERPVGRRVHDGSCSFYSYRSDNLAVLRAAASRKKHSGPTDVSAVVAAAEQAGL